MKTPIFNQLLRKAIAGTIAVLAPLNLASEAQAQAFNPPNEGEPIQTVGGASRGTCSIGPISNVKFFMKQDEQSGTVLEAHLTEGMAKQVFFSLRNSEDETLYQGFLDVDTEQNTVQVPFQNLAQIAEDSHYTWSVAVICGKALRPDSPVFQGVL
ncbi:MAG: DUF928 domain-containing protein [Prochlorotrichaceae cyanobacterium]|jgi:hypothetical protein